MNLVLINSLDGEKNFIFGGKWGGKKINFVYSSTVVNLEGELLVFWGSCIIFYIWGKLKELGFG